MKPVPIYSLLSSDFQIIFDNEILNNIVITKIWNEIYNNTVDKIQPVVVTIFIARILLLSKENEKVERP